MNFILNFENWSLNEAVRNARREPGSDKEHFEAREDERVLGVIDFSWSQDTESKKEILDRIKEIFPDNNLILGVKKRCMDLFKEEYKRRVGILEDKNFPSGICYGYPVISMFLKVDGKEYPIEFKESGIKYKKNKKGIIQRESNGEPILDTNAKYYKGNQVYIPISNNMLKTVLLYSEDQPKSYIDNFIKTHETDTSGRFLEYRSVSEADVKKLFGSYKYVIEIDSNGDIIEPKMGEPEEIIMTTDSSEYDLSNKTIKLKDLNIIWTLKTGTEDLFTRKRIIKEFQPILLPDNKLRIATMSISPEGEDQGNKGLFVLGKGTKMKIESPRGDATEIKIRNISFGKKPDDSIIGYNIKNISI